MRHFIALSVTLAGLLSVIVASPLKTAANDWKIVPGERIGDVSLAMSEDEVEKLLGPPTQSAGSQSGLGSYLWVDHQLTIVTRFSRIEAIVILPGPRVFPYRTDKGIGLGAPMSQVREAYGDVGCVFKNESSTDRFLGWPGLGIQFLFSSASDVRQEFRGGVVNIQVQRPLTPGSAGSSPAGWRPCSELG